MVNMSQKSYGTPKGLKPNGAGAYTPAKRMSAPNPGKMFKAPGARHGSTVHDTSSSKSTPAGQSSSDKKRYRPTPQPAQSSNKGTGGYTRFVC